MLNRPDLDFDPLDPAFDADPYPLYRRLQHEDPVHWWEASGGWLVTRHDDLVEVLLDAKRFSPNRKYWEAYEPPPSGLEDLASVRMLNSTLSTTEGKQHLRLRRLANAAFTRSKVQQLEPMIRSVMDGLIDAHRSRASIDMVADVGQLFPVTTISRMFGIPAGEQLEVRFKELADDIVGLVNPLLPTSELMRGLEQAEEFLSLVHELMDWKSEHPAEDLMSAMLLAEAGDERLTRDEIVSMVFSIIIAGSETVSNAFSLGMRALVRRPDQLKLFLEQRDLRVTAVEELLRFEPSVKYLLRFATEDVKLRGQHIIEGQTVFLSVPAAHRDPDVYAYPDTLDITRDASNNYSFGAGPFFCMGSQLARLELKIAFETVLEELPNLRFDAEDWSYTPHSVLRVLNRLPLRFDPA